MYRLGCMQECAKERRNNLAHTQSKIVLTQREKTRMGGNFEKMERQVAFYGTIDLLMWMGADSYITNFTYGYG